MKVFNLLTILLSINAFGGGAGNFPTPQKAPVKTILMLCNEDDGRVSVIDVNAGGAMVHIGNSNLISQLDRNGALVRNPVVLSDLLRSDQHRRTSAILRIQISNSVEIQMTVAKNDQVDISEKELKSGLLLKPDFKSLYEIVNSKPNTSGTVDSFILLVSNQVTLAAGRTKERSTAEIEITSSTARITIVDYVGVTLAVEKFSNCQSKFETN